MNELAVSRGVMMQVTKEKAQWCMCGHSKEVHGEDGTCLYSEKDEGYQVDSWCNCQMFHAKSHYR